MQTNANKTAVQMLAVKPTPFITSDGFQKVTVTLTSKRKYIQLWGEITVAEHIPYTVSFVKISRGDRQLRGRPPAARGYYIYP